jgi:hypothetical protein
MKNKIKDLLKITGLPIVFASLCCLSPLILVLLGLSTASFAGSLADTFYGDYKWVFRGVGLILLIATTVTYLRRKKGICTLDDVKKRRWEIINLLLLVFVVGAIGYAFFLYVVVHYAGIPFGIWENY